MGLSDRSQDLGSQIEGFFVDVWKDILALIIIGFLDRLSKYLVQNASYGWRIFRVKSIQEINYVLLALVVAYPKLRKSRLAGILPDSPTEMFPIIRVFWLALLPSSLKALTFILRHNHSDRNYALSVVHRSSAAITEILTNPKRDAPEIGCIILSTVFQLASKSIIEPSQELDAALLRIRETVQKIDPSVMPSSL